MSARPIPYSGGVGIPYGSAQPAPSNPKALRRRPGIRSAGLVVRFSPIKGQTPKSALDRHIWLPATLNTVTMTEPALHNEYDTLSAGHFSQAQMGPPDARQFRTTSFDSLTVEIDPPWMVYHGQDPYELRIRLREILRARKPVRLLGTLHPNPNAHHEMDMYVTFRSFTEDVQRPGERETRYFTIAISEWRDPSVKRRSHHRESGGSSSRKQGVNLPTTTTLAADDTLASIAYAFYGRYDEWRTIRDANGIGKRFGQKDKLVTLGGHFKVGAKIKVPAIPFASDQRAAA